jgi:hypothetical protein
MAVFDNAADTVMAVFDNAADTVMAVFDNAADAVNASAAIQEAGAAAASSAEVATGVVAAFADAGVQDGDWFGTPMLEAACVGAAVAAGPVVGSDRVQQSAGHSDAGWVSWCRPDGAEGVQGAGESPTTLKSDPPSPPTGHLRRWQ